MEPLCKHLVSEGWNDDEGQDIQDKVKRCSTKLMAWGDEITTNFSGIIKSCKLTLKKLRHKHDDQSLEEYEAAKKRLHLTLDQREIFWRQRSKQL